MRILHNVSAFEKPKKPVVLTIGNFDGVHLGHQQVLNTVKRIASDIHGTTVVLTFSNHPSEILRPDRATRAICTVPHKMKLIGDRGVDTTLLLPFTKEFSQQTAETFLTALRQHVPFSHLVLGYDAVIGHQRGGDRTTVEAMAKKHNFTVTYLHEVKVAGTGVSSTSIRSLIEQGNFNKVSELLGRRYSIYSHVIKGAGRGVQLGFPTINVEVGDLCLPPYGVYSAVMIANGMRRQGVANLGIAPTVRNETTPVLEIHVFDGVENFATTEVEVELGTFLRPEQKFSSIDALKAQIASDIAAAKKIAL